MIKLCTECKFSNKNVGDCRTVYFCNKYTNFKTSMVNGFDISDYVYCEEARANELMCGKEAKGFEQKTFLLRNIINWLYK